VVICALLVTWTAGLPLSVVLGVMAQDPLLSVTELPETVQVWPAAPSKTAQAPMRTSAATARNADGARHVGSAISSICSPHPEQNGLFATDWCSDRLEANAPKNNESERQ
jgi:hypothetical protein